MSVNYRKGVSSRDGRALAGFAHLTQSIQKIVTTMPTERVMRLDFGMNPTKHLGRNISPAFAAALYRDLVLAIHKYEPEYRIRRMQLVGVDRGGTLALALTGTYYPEGRLGNYKIAEAADLVIPLPGAEAVAV